MAVRLPSSVSKILLLAVLGLLVTGGITYAAEQKLATPPAPAAGQATPQKQAEIVVPDVRREAFVFAKGALQDAGLAWKVVGAVHGYPANVVLSQAPAAGTRVLDTGAPLVTLTLSRNGKYSQRGTPEDVSPYAATPVRLAGVPAALLAAAAPKPAAPKPAAPKPAAPKPAAPKPAAPKPAAPKPAAPKPAAPKPAAKPAAAHAKPARAKYPQNRPVAFDVPGAPKEPLDEMPLPDRASALARWIVTRPKPTNANVERWLYQNAWIVTGAKFGWWRGAEALRILVAADRRTEVVWGIGSKSRLRAERALAEVEADAR